MNARTTTRLFSRETAVDVAIHATPAALWSILTDGARYPHWTSTVLSIEGDIAPGARIRLKSSLDPKRTFRLAVREFVAPTRLVWGDAMGRRTFMLSAQPDGSTRFQMRERIGGPLFPLFARMIPSFDASFTQFAADLKRRAETVAPGRQP